MVKGINFKENNSGTIEVGIHTDFIEYLKSLSPNAAGYFNFNLVKNYKPSSKGGYTHRLELQGKQAKDQTVTNGIEP